MPCAAVIATMKFSLGRVDELFNQNPHGHEMNKSQKGMPQFLILGGNTAKLFEFVEEPFPYGQNIRTRLPTGGYASYHRPHLGLSSAPLSQILSIHKNGNGVGGEAMDWKHLLAYITGTVDQE